MSARWTKKPEVDGWYVKSFTGKENDDATAIYIRDGKYNYVGQDLDCTYAVSDASDADAVFYGPITFPKKKVKA